jgi:hypothetical protein
LGITVVLAGLLRLILQLLGYGLFLVLLQLGVGNAWG